MNTNHAKWHELSFITLIKQQQTGVVLLCLLPNVFSQNVYSQNCLLLKCLLCQNVYSKNVYCAKMSTPKMSTMYNIFQHCIVDAFSLLVPWYNSHRCFLLLILCHGQMKCMVMYQYPTCDMHFVHRKRRVDFIDFCQNSLLFQVIKYFINVLL